jgi:hypothetical protein
MGQVTAAADSPLVRFLTDPGDAAANAIEVLVEVAPPVLASMAAATGLLATWMAVRTWVRSHRQARLSADARIVTILAPPEVEASGAAALWSNLHDLLRPRWRRLLGGQPHLGFEYGWSDRGLEIRMWVPGVVPPGMVERAIEAAWPAARTTTEPVTDALPEGWGAGGGALRLAAPDCFPLRTDFDADPLRAVLAAGAVEREGQAAVVQVLARPAPHRAVARCRRAARDVRLGRAPRRGLRLLDLLTPGAASTTTKGDPTVAPDVRAILSKAEGPLWMVGVRYGVAEAESNLPALRGRSHALASTFALYAGRNRLVRRRVSRPGTTLNGRHFRRGDLLSTEELAALAHVPLDKIVPSLARAGARAVAPSPRVSRERLAGKLIGDADAGGARPVVIRTEDARFHLHVMGATGSGKSTLLTNLILEDVKACRGTVVIDPAGDLVRDVLARMSNAERARVVLLDPESEDGRPRLNMLEVPSGITPDLVVDNLVGIFSRIFEKSWGPRLEDVLRSTCLTLLQHTGGTLSDVPRLLTFEGEYAKHLTESSPRELRDFWGWYEAQSTATRAQMVGPLLYKLRAFLLRPAVRQIVNAPKSSVDMGRILDGGILLARLPKGTLGEDTSRLLGSFIVAKVWQAATARAALGQEARIDSSLYVDECQNFLTLPRSFDEILAEARKYRLSLVLAHQHLGQLPRELRDAVSANARNKVLFSMSPEDAFVLQRHTTPNLTEHDLANLSDYQAAVRLVVDGQDQPAFTIRTRPAPEPRAA